MVDVKDPGPLTWNIPIVDVRSGRPSPEFQRRWNTQRNNDAQISGGITSISKSSNFITTADINCYFLNTAGGAYTVTLNATPEANEVVEVFDSTGHASANPISFNGNGKTIAGSSVVSNFINIDYGHSRLIFNGIEWLMH